MKIKKFNENIEWLDGEIMPLRDLTGQLVEEIVVVNPNFDLKSEGFDFVKKTFSRGTFTFDFFDQKRAKSYDPTVQRLLEKNVRIEFTDKIRDYQFASILVLDESNKFVVKMLTGIFDLNGNLVFIGLFDLGSPYFIDPYPVYYFDYNIVNLISSKPFIESRIRLRIGANLETKQIYYEAK